MRKLIQELITQALLDMQREGSLPKELEPEVVVERTRSIEHGDFASNVALTLAKPARRAPREIAEEIIDRLLSNKNVEKVELAGPGFINFYLTQHSLQSVITQILAQGDDYGQGYDGNGTRVQVEFVSANPTGPLHVGHGRGAAYGATLSNILEAAGYHVQREYYVNDAGRQMDILATSVWLRYLELGGTQVAFPANGYQGDYIYDVARTVRQDHGDDLRRSAQEVSDGLPEDGIGDDPEAKDQREVHIDALVLRAKQALGDEQYGVCYEAALNAMVDDIREDLARFNVVYDNWFSERELASSGSVQRALDQLREQSHLYEKDGAQWLRATEFGDEKDRVVIREDGRTTYFASDIAYFLNKVERGFDRTIYVLGADHHGYVARLRAAASGLGKDPEMLEIPLVQFAHLYRHGEKVQMSTRSGKFVTLRELREEVGTDAARFFYVMRSHDQHLDFDLDLAKSQSQDNPVYYIQYAHARVASMFRKLDDKGYSHNSAIGAAALERLTEPHENTVMRSLAQYPEVISAAARKRAPHLMAHYLRDLAQDFHSYYNAHQVLVDDEDLRNARLNLSQAVGQVLANGLKLLGVSAPDSM
ncbi:MAG: arginine--tRNA ligase [Xanthomonadales bacterium]|nr:arginine--tRNA ligase [Xanthomonadales bacterium]